MNSRESNKQYLGLNDKQYDRHCRLMQMTDWPDNLEEYVREVTGQVGACGEVIACAIADWLKIEKVRVEFTPVVPDDTRSLYKILMKVAKEFGLADCREPWTGGILVMNIPADENSWKFCKRMRRSCEVSVFQSD